MNRGFTEGSTDPAGLGVTRLPPTLGDDVPSQVQVTRLTGEPGYRVSESPLKEKIVSGKKRYSGTPGEVGKDKGILELPSSLTFLSSGGKSTLSTPLTPELFLFPIRFKDARHRTDLVSEDGGSGLGYVKEQRRLFGVGGADPRGTTGTDKG